MSLVDMSPSTVMVLNVSSTASASAACSTAGATVASVVMKQSIVAMLGWIIPDPFAIAANFTALPPMSISRNATFVRRSVVRIASAAGIASSPSAATSAGTAAAIRSTGSGVPIAPVDAVSTASASMPRASATALATARSSAAPRGPTIAFALPLLATMARMSAAGQPPGAEVAGRGAHAVDREPPGRRAGRVRDDQRDVAAGRSGLLDARGDGAETKPDGTEKLFAADVLLKVRSRSGSAGLSSLRGPASGWRSGRPVRPPP